MTKKQIYSVRKMMQKLGYTNISIRKVKPDRYVKGYRVKAKWHGSLRVSTGYCKVNEVKRSMRGLAHV